jgi:hypothetical protein
MRGIELRRGIISELERKRANIPAHRSANVLGPVIFVYKRFNQHVYGIACDERTIDLDGNLKHLTPLGSMFMDACIATQECCSNLRRKKQVDDEIEIAHSSDDLATAVEQTATF